MNQKIRVYHTDMLRYMTVGTLQLASATMCKGVHIDGLINRWHRGTTCSPAMIRAQAGSTELHSRTLLKTHISLWYMTLLHLCRHGCIGVQGRLVGLGQETG